MVQVIVLFFVVGVFMVGKVFMGEVVGDQGVGQFVIDCGDGYMFVQEVLVGVIVEIIFMFFGIFVG